MVMQSSNITKLRQLKMDEAYVTLMSLLNYSISLFSISTACEKCPQKFLAGLASNENVSFIVTTDYAHSMTVKSENEVVCRFTETFSEYGNYLIEVFYSETQIARCSEVIFLNTTFHNYIDQIIPLNLIAILSFLMILYYSPKVFQLTYQFIMRAKNYLMPSTLPESKFKDVAASNSNIHFTQMPKSRLTSLDAFRGLNIILMIFINSGGGGYSLFKHSIWHGINFAEFPHGWFNWIMGMSVALSGSYERKTVTTYERIERAVQRTTKLIFLGLSVSSVNFTADLDKIPFFGVLQDLGILYLLVVFIDIIIPRKNSVTKHSNFLFLDLNILWPQWSVLILAVIVHNSFLFGFNVPLCGRGYLGPGGDHLYAKYKLCTGGTAGYIDRLLMPTHSAYGIKFMRTYNTPLTFDPYGPFGLIGQIVQVYFGILAGEMFLLHKEQPKNVFKRWIFLSFILCVLSHVLCNKPLDICFIPCSRKLWTLTYTCYICSSAFLLLSVLYFIIDIQKLWSGWPTIYPGTNSVFIYVAHSCTRKSQIFPFDWPTRKTHFNLLFKNLWQVFVWTLISAVMYHKKIFLTV